MVYLRNKKDFDAGLLLSQSLSCKIYKTYTAAFYFKIEPKQKKCPFRVAADQSRKQGDSRGGEAPARKMFAHPGKICRTQFGSIGHSLKIWATPRNLYAPPGVPSWLRACG